MTQNPVAASLRAMRSTQPQGHLSMTDHLFKPAVETLAAQLPDIGTATATMLAELASDPTPERAELMQVHLRGVQHYVATLREAAKQKAA